jgi:hypothetical protein
MNYIEKLGDMRSSLQCNKNCSILEGPNLNGLSVIAKMSGSER